MVDLREEVARVIAKHASDWDPEYGGGGGEDPVQTDYALADAVLALVRDAGLIQPLPAPLTMYGDAVDAEYVDMIADSDDPILLKELMYLLWERVRVPVEPKEPPR